MRDNVISFEEALQSVGKQKQECNHEQVCEHCSIKNDWVATLITQLYDLNTQEAIEFLGDLYEEAFQDGQRDAYDNIAGFAIHNIRHLDGYVEED